MVKLVEAWMAEGTPTARARLAQARAFFDLRLMDRATLRARELEETPEHQEEVLLLLARIYVERGWPLRARKPLVRLREAGVDVRDLWDRAHQEPVRPETRAREIEREARPAEMLALAESFLATGSFMRGSGILERLRPAHPENGRPEDLLWAIAGDFTVPSGSLDELVDGLALTTGMDLSADEPERTETRSREHDVPPEEASRFPALFQQSVVDAARPEEDGDHTQSSGIATPEQMAGTGEGTAPSIQVRSLSGGSDAGDTQILLVLRPGEDGHRRRSPDRLDTLDGAPINLREWQKAMGGRPAPRAADLTEDRLEAEDENVVMMTRHEPAPPPDPEPTESRVRPIKVVEKHLPPATNPQPEVEVIPAAPLGLSRLGLILGGGILLLLVIAALLVLAYGQLRPAVLGEREQIEAVLAENRYEALEAEEREIAPRASADPEAALALARVRLQIWREWDGAPDRVRQVREFLDAPGAADAQGVKVLAAAEALARNDLDGAEAALAGRAPRTADERLVFEELAVRLGRPLVDYPGLPAGSASPRARRVLAAARAASGHVADARDTAAALLSADPTDIQAAVLSLEFAGGTPESRLERASAMLRRALAPRLEARVAAVASKALIEMNRAADAEVYAVRGLARDGANPTLLHRRASTLVGRQELVNAARDLELAGRSPGAQSKVEVAYVLLLLDLDRVDEAVLRVASVRRRDPTLAPVLGVVTSVAGTGTVPETLPPLGADALGAYADALVASVTGAPDASVRLAEAAARVAADPDPFLARLAPRLRAAQAAADPAGAAELVTVVEEEAADDPMAHLALALYFEQTGERGRAAMHIDRASALGPEYARIWYERARFYEGAEDPQERSQEARFRYLGLSPSGPRAERARSWVVNGG